MWNALHPPENRLAAVLARRFYRLPETIFQIGKRNDPGLRIAHHLLGL